MKKYLCILTVLCLLPFAAKASGCFNDSESFTVSKAVKLGRGGTTFSEMPPILGGGSELEETPEQIICSPDITHCRECAQNSSACSSCESGYRLSNGRCVENCTGMVCAAGYSPKSGATGCCCKPDETIPEITGCPGTCTTCSSPTTCTGCSGGYYLSGGSCLTCPSNATCSGGSFTCNTGYYKSGGSCLSCSSAMTGCSSCSSSTVCTACSGGNTLSNGQCVSDCNYWSISYSSCSRGYRKPKTGGTCTKCPANTECGTCPTGCTGSTAGVCNTSGYTCFRCAVHDLITGCETCPSGYVLTIDRTTCASISGTGYDMHPTCY